MAPAREATSASPTAPRPLPAFSLRLRSEGSTTASTWSAFMHFQSRTITVLVMARPREFDTDQAVDRAMDLFWSRGYAATSLQDLTAVLGIGSGSLYAAFGSKEQLYARALERYSSRNAGALIAELESATDVRSALRAAL